MAHTQPAVTPPAVIPFALARELVAAGLVWAPAQGDRFVIDRGELRDQTWVLSDMVVELHDHPAGQILGFNGTTEWALDAVDADQALWLPAEGQLRTLLGPAFDALECLGPPGSADAAYRVRLLLDAQPLAFDAPDPAQAYGRALLHLLRIGAVCAFT